MCQRAMALLLVILCPGCFPFAKHQDRRRQQLDALEASKTTTSSSSPAVNGSKSNDSKTGWLRKPGAKKSEAAALTYKPLPEIVLVQPEWLDQTCEVQLHTPDEASVTSYKGKLIRADDQVIVLETPELHAVKNDKHPVWGSLFSNTAQGSLQSDKDVTIDRQSIASIRPL